jgi:hypothetical protein
MTVTGHMYGKALNAIATKTINLSSDTIKVMLVTSSYTPNQAADQFASTPGAFEITGTGYTAGGAVLTSIVLADASNVFTLSAANTTWAGAAFATAFGIIYDQTVGTGYSTNPLLGYVNFGGTQSPAGITFAIDWASGVVLQWTAS